MEEIQKTIISEKINRIDISLRDKLYEMLLNGIDISKITKKIVVNDSM